MIKEQFPGWRFSAPSSAAAIESAEVDLGIRLPEELKVLYMQADGFRESIGNSSYLLPLDELVGVTTSLWMEWEGFRPEFDIKPFVFFGLSSADEAWGINWKRPGEIIAFHHHMEGEYELVGSTILEVYKADFEKLT
ncbi:SMI1/KNR4 family protein [Herbaspirillum sp. CAH-3]|uniref:SMI1/KNR4 family protein n=1 Tax=Herbaspirillum sp. CAH-3 TaxID=2605746 RepID=UPI0012ACF64E|nr:SMI1/KNR4 family protein [Herbaspirillum sp. CAH-3]MRT29767.1 SMI1/KNR4 family protein [Herbaspirillum sp. CAH-3]